MSKVAIISDIHANIYAFSSVMEIINKKNIDHIIVAGDIVGYYYWPDKVIKKIMMDSRFHCIKGNHDSLLENIYKNKDQMKKYKKKFGSSYQITLEKLDANQLNWLFNLPKELDLKIDNQTFSIRHGSILSEEEYIYPDSTSDKLLNNYSHSKYTIFGHTHYPFIHTNKNKILINPGSVGQPRDYGDLASFAITDTSNSTIVFYRAKFPTNPIKKEVFKVDSDLPYLYEVLERK